MAKHVDIRWRKSDVEKVKREVKRYNRKIKKAIDSGKITQEQAPKHLTYSEVRKNTQTRAELNRTLKDIKSIHKADALETQTSDYGLTKTNYEIDTLKSKLKQINKERAKQKEFIGNLELLSRGKDTGFKVITRLDEAMKQFEPKKFDYSKKKKSDWEDFVYSVEKQQHDYYMTDKNEQYKTNYMTAIENTFGTDRANELNAIVQQVDLHDFIKNYLQDTEGDMSYIYDDNHGLQDRFDTLKNMWKNILENGA